MTAVTPVELVKKHLRYVFDDRDDYIINLIESAEETVRNLTGLAFYDGPVVTSMSVPAPIGDDDAILIPESKMRNPLVTGMFSPDSILTEHLQINVNNWIEYWTPDADINGVPDGNIVIKGLWRLDRQKRNYIIFPPEDSWPNYNDDRSEFILNITRFLYPVPHNITMAVLTEVARLWNGRHSDQSAMKVQLREWINPANKV